MITLNFFLGPNSLMPGRVARKDISTAGSCLLTMETWVSVAIDTPNNSMLLTGFYRVLQLMEEVLCHFMCLPS